jgi:[ribosomal protein S18]-alanine N-acetyltransferase
MVIRDATTEDLAAIAALEVEVYDSPWSEEIIRDELGQMNRIYLVVETDERIIGFGGAMLVIEDAHITTLGVAPAYRRRGVGSRLLLDLIDRALDAGSRNLTLEVRESNVDAQALYERFGFNHVGRRRGYYRDEDALVMWALDIDTDDYQQRLDVIRSGLGEAA